MDYRRISSIEQIEMECWKTRVEMGLCAARLRTKAVDAVLPRAVQRAAGALSLPDLVRALLRLFHRKR